MKNRFFALITGGLAFFLLSCGSTGERLNSPNRLDALRVAEGILTHSTKIKLGERDIPFLIQALNSENQVVVNAAMEGLVRLSNKSVLLILSNLISPDYRGEKIQNRAVPILRRARDWKFQLPELPVFYQASAMIAEGNKNEGNMLLSQLLEQTNAVDSGKEQAVFLARLGLAYARLNPALARSLFQMSLNLLSSIYNEYDRLTVYEQLSDGISRMEPETVDTLWNDMERALRYFGSWSARSRALNRLSIGVAAQNPEQGLKFAKMIFVGFNRDDYGLVMECAGELGKIDPVYALPLYEIAQTMILALPQADRDAPLLELALRLILLDRERSQQLFEQLGFTGNFREEYWDALTAYYTPKDFRKASYTASLIVDFHQRAQALGYLSSEMGMSNIGEAIAWTNECGMSNSLILLGEIAVNLAKSQDPMKIKLARDLLQDGMGDEFERFEWEMRFASHLSGTNILTAKEIVEKDINRIISLKGSSRQNQYLQQALTYLKDIRGFDTSAQWTQLKNTILKMTNTKVRDNLLLSYVRSVSTVDPELAADLFPKLAPEIYSEVMSRLLSRDVFAEEKEVLARIDGKAGGLVIEHIKHTKDKRVLGDLIRAAYLINEKSGFPYHPEMDFLTSYITNEKYPVHCRAQIVALVSGGTNNAVREISFQILTNRSQPQLKREAVRTLSRGGHREFVQSRVSNWVALASSRITPVEVRENATVMLGISGREEAAPVIRQLLIEQPSPEATFAALDAALKLNLRDTIPLLANLMHHPRYYFQAMDVLARWGQFDLLVQNYWRSPFPSALVETLGVYFPERRKIKRVGLVGFVHNETVYALQTKGYDCIPVKDKEEGKKKGCDMFLIGDYQVQYNQEVEYIDKQGAVVVKGEDHRLRLSIENKDGIVIWVIFGQGFGSAYGLENLGLEDVPQEAVNREARKWLYKDLSSKLFAMKGAIQLNY